MDIIFNNEIDINGVKYRKKEEAVNKILKPKYSQFSEFLSLYTGYLKQPDVSQQRNAEIDLNYYIKEFRLIDQKKSNLSRSERERIVLKFNKYFEKI